MKKGWLLATAGMLVVMPVSGAIAETKAESVKKPAASILTSELSGSDLAFFSGASRDTELVVKLSDLAKKNAVTPEVQALAGKIAEEQAKSGAALKDLAVHKGLPAKDGADASNRKLLKTLGTLTGAKFDKSYLEALQDAQGRLATSLDAGAGSQDKDIRAFAESANGLLKAERESLRKLGL